jgi:hypothetical protein
MRSFLSAVVALVAAFISGVVAVDPTDEYRDADVEQSGYLPNHNMDPTIVNVLNLACRGRYRLTRTNR